MSRTSRSAAPPTGSITLPRIDELLAYLPIFGQSGFRAVRKLGGGEMVAPKTLSMPCPVYRPEVEDFAKAASRPCWRDYGYDPVTGRRLWESDEAIARAGFDEVRTMLTFFARGEKFADGLWGDLIDRGRVVRLLQRIRDLRDTLLPPEGWQDQFPPYEDVAEALRSHLFHHGGAEHALRPMDVYEPLADVLGIPAHVRRWYRPDGAGSTLWQNRVQWARQRLSRIGDLDHSVRNWWRLTPQGVAEAEKAV